MQDPRVAMSESTGALWLAVGSGLVTAPEKTLRLAGIEILSGPMNVVIRILGLRDLALGAAALSAGEAGTRRRIHRGIGAMCAGEAVLIPLCRGLVPDRAVVRLTVASIAAAAQAFAASTYDEDLPSGGVPLLVAGYLLSVAPTLELALVLRERRLPAFAAFEAGCALLALGWWRRRNVGGAVINGLAGVGAGVAWLRRASSE